MKLYDMISSNMKWHVKYYMIIWYDVMWYDMVSWVISNMMWYGMIRYIKHDMVTIKTNITNNWWEFSSFILILCNFFLFRSPLDESSVLFSSFISTSRFRRVLSFTSVGNLSNVTSIPIYSVSNLNITTVVISCCKSRII